MHVIKGIQGDWGQYEHIECHILSRCKTLIQWSSVPLEGQIHIYIVQQVYVCKLDLCNMIVLSPVCHV